MDNNINNNEYADPNGDPIFFSSPFTGTPWKSDQEIYDFASHKRSDLGWEWPQVKAELVKQGLDPGYADAIIENLEEAVTLPEPPTYLKGFVTGLFSSVVIALLAVAFCMMIGKIWIWVIIIGSTAIGVIVQKASHREGGISGLLAAICGAIAVCVFVYMLERQGYTWTDGTSISDDIGLYILGAAFLSGCAAYKEHYNADKD